MLGGGIGGARGSAPPQPITTAAAAPSHLPCKHTHTHKHNGRKCCTERLLANVGEVEELEGFDALDDKDQVPVMM